MVYVTRALVEVLLELAADEEPQSASVVLSATPAGEFDPPLDLDHETPVLTHFYFPGASRSVSAVFGMDLGTPAGRGRARFVTHPQGELSVSECDDLAGVVLVAVPPWEPSTMAAFDRAGRRLELELLDAEPPEERVS